MPKGRKTCPDCDAEVGCRKKSCGCGYEFPIKSSGGKRSVKQNQAVETDSTPVDQAVTPEIVCVNDEQAIDPFIAQLKDAAVGSKRTGGAYSAFLHHRDGTLQVEVGFPMRLK